MGAHQRALQLDPVLDGDVPLRQRAEPGRDAVDRLGGHGEPLDVLPRRGHRRERLRGEHDPGVAARDRHHLVSGHARRAEGDDGGRGCTGRARHAGILS
jgi:hypothetical protein